MESRLTVSSLLSRELALESVFTAGFNSYMIMLLEGGLEVTFWDLISDNT